MLMSAKDVKSVQNPGQEGHVVSDVKQLPAGVMVRVSHVMEGRNVGLSAA